MVGISLLLMRVLLLLMIEILLLILLMLVPLLRSFSGILLLCSLCIFTCNSLCRLLGLRKGIKMQLQLSSTVWSCFRFGRHSCQEWGWIGRSGGWIGGSGLTLQQPWQALGRWVVCCLELPMGRLGHESSSKNPSRIHCFQAFAV